VDRIPEEIIQSVLDQADICEIIGSAIPLKRAGRDYKGLCPFHSEKTPSFSVSPSKRIFRCFGCGTGGNVISFLMKMESKNFPQVVKELADRLGIALPDENRGLFTTLMEMHRVATDYFSHCLSTSSMARNYLSQRGLSQELISSENLGYAPGDWGGLLNQVHAKLGRVEPEVLTQSGLFSQSQGGKIYDRFRDRIMFPIRNSTGRVIAFGGRILTETEKSPKYLNSPETPLFEKGKILYNLHGLPKGESLEILVVEGYMDVLALVQAGVSNVVAPLGTGFTASQVPLLEERCQKVVLVFDGDQAGSTATLRAVERFIDSELMVTAVRLPQGVDPQDFIDSQGKENFLKTLTQAPVALRFYCEEVMRQFPLKERRTRKQAYVKIRDFLRGVNPVMLFGDDTVNEPEIVRFLGQRFDVDEAIIRKQFFGEKSLAVENSSDDSARIPAQIELGLKLMVWSLPQPHWKERVLESLDSEFLSSSLATELHEILLIPGKPKLADLMTQASPDLSSFLCGIQWEDGEESVALSEEDFWVYFKEFRVQSLQARLMDLSRQLSNQSLGAQERSELEKIRRKTLAEKMEWIGKEISSLTVANRTP
jgi:DNA primase